MKAPTKLSVGQKARWPLLATYRGIEGSWPCIRDDKKEVKEVLLEVLYEGVTVTLELVTVCRPNSSQYNISRLINELDGTMLGESQDHIAMKELAVKLDRFIDTLVDHKLLG